jgi:hypothetical protein
MNKLFINLLLLVCSTCAPLCLAQEAPGSGHARLQTTRGVMTGEWAAEFRPDTGAVHLMIHRRVGAQGSDKRYFLLSLYRLEGLSQVLPIQNESNLKFQLTRDAGTFLFQGVFQNGTGSGSYQFTYNPAFITKMRELGYDNISPENQFLMAVHDISISLARELRELKGRSLPFDELISIGREGVNSDFIRGLRASGIELKSEQQLAEMRRHGVTPDFIKELAAMGYERPSIDQLLGMKLFGVTPDFIKTLDAFGYRRLSIDLLTCLRIHGITIDYIKQVTDNGRKKLSLRELVRSKNPNGQSKGSCELQVFPDGIPD